MGMEEIQTMAQVPSPLLGTIGKKRSVFDPTSFAFLFF
jgi:hypothetical protein